MTLHNNTKTFGHNRDWFQYRFLTMYDYLTEENETSAIQGSQLGMLKFSTTYKPNTNVHIDYDIFGKMSKQTELLDVSSTERGAVDTYKEEKPFSLNQNFNLVTQILQLYFLNKIQKVKPLLLKEVPL